MKKSNKFLFLALISILFVAILAACGTSEEPAQENEEQTQGSNEEPAKDDTEAPAEKVKLVMGTSADYPPYEYIDTAKGEEIIGFDIDIANYIADQLGFELEVKDMDFGGLIPALTQNRVDFVLAGMTPTPDRLENVDFSQIYYVAEQMIVSKKEAGIESLEDLAGKKLGVQLGSIQVDLAKGIAESYEGVEILERNKITDLIQELKSNRIDAAVIEDKVAEGHLAANDDLTAFIVEEEGEAGSAVAFPKGSDLVEQFDAVIQEMKENGEMDRLIMKWFYDEE